MTAPESNGDHGQQGRRQNAFVILLRWCRQRVLTLFTVLGAWLVAMWRAAGVWREHLLAAWAEARSSLWRRRWFGEYWRALVQRAGRGPARRFVFTALIACLILTGSGGLFLTNVLFPQLFGGSNVTHSPNTLDQFKNGGNAYGQTGAQTPTPHAPVTTTGSALTPAQAPSSTAATTLQPVIITLDPARYLNNGSQSVGAVSSYVASDSVLEFHIADTSVDLTSATPTGATIPTYTPSPKPTPSPTPTGPITGATPTATGSAAHAASSSSRTVPSPRQSSQLSQGAQARLATLAPHATGPFTLEFTPSQVAFYGSHNGALLGGFTLRVLDGSRKELTGVKLHAPLTVRFHYQPGELSGLNASDIRLVWTATGDQAAKKPAQYVPVTVDTANNMLSATVPDLVGGSMALAASSSDAGTASSEHLSMSGNTGDTQFTVPLQIPPAAGGLAPNLQLTYGSGGPNGRHGDNASAPATGDGWNLNLGSITYDSSYPDGNVYFLNGVGGVSEPILCCSNDTDDNNPSTGNNYFVPHHHPNVRIQVEDNSTDPSVTGKCFHVWTPDGMYYELGCDPNNTHSRRSNVNAGALQYIEWDVNKVQRLADTGTGYLQQYTVTYWEDTAPTGGQTHTRDAFLKEIDYNYVGGVAQARVLFNIHWINGTDTSGPATATTYGVSNYNCSTTPPNGIITSQRCDDPVDQPGWTAAPLVYSTITLDRVTPQLLSGGTWKTVRTYDLSYADTAFTQCWDGFNLQWHACAGAHLLTQVQETPYQNNIAMPSRQPLVFTYTAPVKNEYFDTTMTTWNGGHIFDDQDWWQYLSTFTDQQTGAGGSIAWKGAYGNTHGVPSGSNVLDPFACDASGVNCFTGSPNPPSDRQWQRQAVASITDNGTGTTTSYAYTLKQTCGTNCTQDTWIPPNQFNTCGGVAQPPQSTMQSCLLGNFANYYMQEYTGFETVTTTHPDSSTTWEQYYAGAGWGTNDWDIANLYRDQALVTDVYQGSPTGAPLQETRSTYQWDLNQQNSTTCPVVIPSTGYQLFRTPYLVCYNHEIERDTYQGGSSTSSPAVPKTTQTWTYNTAPPQLNHFHDELLSTTTTTNDTLKDSYVPSPNGYGSTQPVIKTSYDYTYRDGATETQPKPYYFLNLVAQTRVSDNSAPASTYWRCSQTRYDLSGYSTGVNNSSLKAGLATRTDTFQACDGGTGTNALSTGQGYDTFGQVIATVDADALANPVVPGHETCPKSGALDTNFLFVSYPDFSSTNYFTTCRKYDTIYHAYSVSEIGNLKDSSQQNVGTTTAYDYLQDVPTSTTDPNGQVTTSAGPVYEYNGSVSLANFQDVYAQQMLPAQPTSWGNPPVPYTNRTFSYSFCAAATGSKPCLETDTVRQYDGTNLLVTRQIYDRDGRLAQTRSTGPNAGQDVVTYTTYDDQNDKTFTSQPCVVPTLTTSNGGRTVSSTPNYIAPTQVSGGTSAWIDPSVSGTNCFSGTVLGTTTYKDALGRTIATDDAAGTGVGTSGSGCLLPGGSFHHTNCVTYTAIQASTTSGLPTSDTQPYSRTLTIDAKLHQSASYTDALGRTIYTQQFTGSGQTTLGGNIASYAVANNVYDATGALRIAYDPAGNATTWIYSNTVGRLSTLVDPDRGTEDYYYDANGNVTKTVNARGGTAGTVCTTYDGLNRQIGRQQWTGSACSATNYVTYTYDSTSGGNVGLGRLTGESFTGTFAGASQTGTYSYAYDARGEVTTSALTVFGNTYTTTAQYNELGSLTQQGYPGGIETVSYSYSPSGLLNSMQTSASPGQNLIDGFTYSATNGLLVGAHLGGTYAYTVGYDSLLRPQDTQVRRISGNVLLYEETDGYDAAGNVFSVDTTLPAGTDHQKFCYDEQNRLTYATNQGMQSSQSCAAGNTAGTLTSALYQYTFGYDTLDRLTSGPAGGYTYGDSAHKHAATAVGGGYTAKYDAGGNMSCRAPTSTQTCSGTITGAALTYDNEGRLTAWQNAQSSPTSTDSYLYDGEGNRVAQQSASGGVTTQSVYVSDLMEVRTVTGGPPSPGNITYYSANGSRIAMMVSAVLSYLVNDHLSSASLVLDTSGSAVASQLYSPYGALRYSNGVMPTDYGFTGQRTEALTGLDYFKARYYDPVVGRFTSADTKRDGQDRYAYVGDNPTSRTDPTGHTQCAEECDEQNHPTRHHGANCDIVYCAAVLETFRDSRTRTLMLKYLNLTAVGKQFLDYLIYMGQKLGGDKFITWKSMRSDILGTTAIPGGYISLNSALRSGSFGDDAELAATLVHEGVESCIEVCFGLRRDGNTAKIRVDYVAEWFAGKFLSQLGSLLGGSFAALDKRAYGHTFDDWKKNTENGRYYAGNCDDPCNGPVNMDPDRQYYAWGPNDGRANDGICLGPVCIPFTKSSGTYVGHPPNPMLLIPAMLQPNYLFGE